MSLARRLAAVERALGATVCFHDHTGRLEALAGSARIQHRNPFCARLKRTHGAACSRCDATFCQATLARHEAGFLKRCHAGVIEAYAPIRDGDGLAGAVFIGPWRWSGTRLPPEIVSDPQPATTPPTGAPPVAATDDPQRLEDALAFAQLLAAHAERLLAAPAERGDEAARLAEFATLNLTRDPGLPDLARHLGISPRSASRRVQAACGCTWPQLLARQRLTRARRLLELTGLEVGEVARRCGLPDHRSLARLFQRVHGCTPSAWRQRPLG